MKRTEVHQNLPGTLLLSQLNEGVVGEGSGNFLWSPTANGGGAGGGTGGYDATPPFLAKEGVPALGLWIFGAWFNPERILLSITFVGKDDMGVRISALHSGQRNNNGGRGNPFESSSVATPFFSFCFEAKSSKQAMQKVCWHGKTLWDKSRGSRQTEHSSRSVIRPSRDPSGTPAPTGATPPAVIEGVVIMNHSLLNEWMSWMNEKSRNLICWPDVLLLTSQFSSADSFFHLEIYKKIVVCYQKEPIFVQKSLTTLYILRICHSMVDNISVKERLFFKILLECYHVWFLKLLFWENFKKMFANLAPFRRIWWLSICWVMDVIFLNLSLSQSLSPDLN